MRRQLKFEAKWCSCPYIWSRSFAGPCRYLFLFLKFVASVIPTIVWTWIWVAAVGHRWIMSTGMRKSGPKWINGALLWLKKTSYYTKNARDYNWELAKYGWEIQMCSLIPWLTERCIVHLPNLFTSVESHQMIIWWPSSTFLSQGKWMLDIKQVRKSFCFSEMLSHTSARRNCTTKGCRKRVMSYQCNRYSFIPLSLISKWISMSDSAQPFSICLVLWKLCQKLLMSINSG